VISRRPLIGVVAGRLGMLGVGRRDHVRMPRSYSCFGLSQVDGEATSRRRYAPCGRRTAPAALRQRAPGRGAALMGALAEAGTVGRRRARQRPGASYKDRLRVLLLFTALRSTAATPWRGRGPRASGGRVVTRRAAAAFLVFWSPADRASSGIGSYAPGAGRAPRAGAARSRRRRPKVRCRRCRARPRDLFATRGRASRRGGAASWPFNAAAAGLGSGAPERVRPRERRRGPDVLGRCREAGRTGSSKSAPRRPLRTGSRWSTSTEDGALRPDSKPAYRRRRRWPSRRA